MSGERIFEKWRPEKDVHLADAHGLGDVVDVEGAGDVVEAVGVAVCFSFCRCCGGCCWVFEIIAAVCGYEERNGTVEKRVEGSEERECELAG